MANSDEETPPKSPPVIEVDLLASSFQIQKIESEDGAKKSVRIVMVMYWAPDEDMAPVEITAGFVFGSPERAIRAGKNLLEAATLWSAEVDN
jgi:hypothetical protein